MARVPTTSRGRSGPSRLSPHLPRSAPVRSGLRAVRGRWTRRRRRPFATSSSDDLARGRAGGHAGLREAEHVDEDVHTFFGEGLLLLLELFFVFLVLAVRSSL